MRVLQKSCLYLETDKASDPAGEFEVDASACRGRNGHRDHGGNPRGGLDRHRDGRSAQIPTSSSCLPGISSIHVTEASLEVL